MNHDLKRVDQWLAKNRMIPNVKKTKYMVIGSRQAMKKANNIGIYLDSEMLDEVTTFDYLGVRICNVLSWEHHVNKICQRMYPKFGLLNRISSFLPTAILLRIYKQTNKQYYPFWTMVLLCGMNVGQFKQNGSKNCRTRL